MAIRCNINQAIGELEFTFSDGRIQQFRPSRAHSNNRAYAEYHGWKQRLVDSMAVSADETPGRTSEEEKFANLAALIEFYESGSPDWSVRKATTFGGGSDRKLLLQALTRMGKAPDAERFAALTKAQITALLAREDIRPVADAIRAEQTANVDTESLIDELGI